MFLILMKIRNTGQSAILCIPYSWDECILAIRHKIKKSEFLDRHDNVDNRFNNVNYALQEQTDKVIAKKNLTLLFENGHLDTQDTRKYSEKNLTLYFENGHWDTRDTWDTQKYSVKKSDPLF